jgi:hypothetical protein
MVTKNNRTNYHHHHHHHLGNKSGDLAIDVMLTSPAPKLPKLAD